MENPSRLCYRSVRELVGRRTDATMIRRAYSVSRRPHLVTVTDGGRTALVMIGPVRGPEHLVLIHRLGYYHVPVSAIAASRTAVAFVAFYEPASRFGARTGAIREYAEVLHVSRTLRRELPGLTWRGRGDEDTPYYRFDLGPILALPQAIINPERLRVVFRFPDVERLHQAATIRDLGGHASGGPIPSSDPSPVRPGGPRQRKGEKSIP